MTRVGDSPVHLARRFGQHLGRPTPDDSDLEWVRGLLSEDEQVMWSRMATADQYHSIGVARRVGQELGQETTDDVLVAALMHDVGKTAAGLGTMGRVVAALVRPVVGPERARSWAEGRGPTRRIGLHLRYPEIGARMLADAASARLVVAWAREHHRPERDWTVPRELGRVLQSADS